MELVLLQLGSDVDEKELLAAFRRFGRVTGHSMIRRSNCAFVDFESSADAAEAKEALNWARFGSCHIRLEFKVRKAITSRILLQSAAPFRAFQSHAGWGQQPHQHCTA